MPRRIRVLYVIASLAQGGAERQLAELICGLDPDRYEARLALCDMTDQLGYDLPVGPRYDLESAAGSTPKTLYKIVNVLRDAEPDIVHSFMGLVNIYSRLAVGLTGIGRAIGAVRNGRPPMRDLVYEGLTQRLAHGMIANSVGIRDKLVRVSRIPPARIDVIENGVDLAKFRPPTADERAERRARWAMTGTTLVLTGRLSTEKNHLAVVQALGALRSKGALAGDAQILFAGRPSPESHAAMLHELAASLGVASNVRFLGPVKNVEELVGAADGLILPSHYEGIPNAVLEALACGAPAVVSPAANLDAIVHDGVEGLTCASSSAADVEAGLARFFALSSEARQAMGARGREAAKARFSVPRMVARTCEVYDRVLAARTR